MFSDWMLELGSDGFSFSSMNHALLSCAAALRGMLDLHKTSGPLSTFFMLTPQTAPP